MCKADRLRPLEKLKSHRATLKPWPLPCHRSPSDTVGSCASTNPHNGQWGLERSLEGTDVQSDGCAGLGTGKTVQPGLGVSREERWALEEADGGVGSSSGRTDQPSGNVRSGCPRIEKCGADMSWPL